MTLFKSGSLGVTSKSYTTRRRCGRDIRRTASDWRIGRQNEQAVHLFRQAEFLRRTHHALARDAENFPFLDDERHLVARLQRQREIRQDERHLVAGLVVLRAANDSALALAVGDLQTESLSEPGTGSRVRIWATTMPSNAPPSFLDGRDLRPSINPLGQFFGDQSKSTYCLSQLRVDFHFVIGGIFCFSCEPSEKSNGLGPPGKSCFNFCAGVESNLNFKCYSLITIFAQPI